MSADQDQSPTTKKEKICCNLENGSVGFEYSWLMQSSFIYYINVKSPNLDLKQGISYLGEGGGERERQRQRQREREREKERDTCKAWVAQLVTN
jgi:hypothetical protein